VYFLRDLENSPGLYYIGIILNIIVVSTVYGWFSWSSNSSYKIIKYRDIEPWIKARYKLTTFYSFINILRPIGQVIRPWNYETAGCKDLACLLGTFLSAIIVVISAIALGLTWVMPSKFKKYLNRNYKPSKENQYEKGEMNEIIKYLGDILSEKIGLSSNATRGMIKLAIREQLGAYIQFDKCSFNNLILVIRESLRNRLSQLHSQNKINIYSVNDLTEDMVNQLIIGQAIITMSNV